MFGNRKFSKILSKKQNENGPKNVIEVLLNFIRGVVVNQQSIDFSQKYTYVDVQIKQEKSDTQVDRRIV